MSRAGKRVLTEETGERIAEALEGFSAPVAIEDALAIVCNGNTAPANIASGKYLFIKNHSTLPAGGYHATAAISAGSELNLGNVEPDEDGIANSLSEQIANLDTVTNVHIIQDSIIAYRAGRFVYLSCISGTYSKDANGKLENNGTTIIIPRKYVPVISANFVEPISGKRFTIGGDGYIYVDGALSSIGCRFSVSYITTASY